MAAATNQAIDQSRPSRHDASPSSDETLGANATEDHRDRPDAHNNREPSDSDEEKGRQSSPPHPVGFFDSALSKVRLQVFGLWARTSQFQGSMHIIIEITDIR